MITTARVTILMFAGLVVIGIWQAAFQEGFSWAAWLDSWFFSLLSMLLIIGVFIGCGALLFAVIRHFRNLEPREESSDQGAAKKKIQ
jgi:TRAP-type C4-dicarboxylate transport system permease small subunit